MSAHNTVQPLVYNGEIITQRDELISLTDMWKAAGSPEGQRPDDWKKDAGNRAFLDHVAIISNAPVKGIWKGRRGNGGGTDAHWQVGLAYAKYLSPAFHAWCNTVVRERMEGKPVSVATLPPDVIEMITRDFGISRQLSGKVKQIEDTLAAIIEVVRPSTPVRYRYGKTAGEIWDRYNLPKLKNAPTWLGNRLAEMGCMADRFDLGRKAIRLFDPDRAEVVMKNGLLHRTRQYISERQGQGKLRLIGVIGA